MVELQNSLELAESPVLGIVTQVSLDYLACSIAGRT
jgi:hypothetical protein